ncbi:unnamed protein product [Protopolystoma xenopodis]|uniref:OTU domain-containing protein n=1 Tax=Protopolystoma xenopodis TaxID=117903 RepID=A0A3S5AKW4_9PLAT|nr:unnamed protein product [Protopolystoma xenopodis]
MDGSDIVGRHRREKKALQESPVILQKTSRAEKRRAKKAVAQENQNKAFSELIASSSDTPRFKEFAEINKLLSQESLVLYEVPSDGDCLFSSVSHQLELLRHSKVACTRINDKNLIDEPTILDEKVYTIRELRKLAAEYIRSHVNEFLPFLINPDTGRPMALGDIDSYCDNLRDTSSWGGDIELRALSCELKRPIEVIQATGPKIKVGEEFISKPLIITYHRHAFSLGEHYNSCRPLPCEPPNRE